MHPNRDLSVARDFSERQSRVVRIVLVSNVVVSWSSFDGVVVLSTKETSWGHDLLLIQRKWVLCIPVVDLAYSLILLVVYRNDSIHSKVHSAYFSYCSNCFLVLVEPWKRNWLFQS